MKWHLHDVTHSPGRLALVLLASLSFACDSHPTDTIPDTSYPELPVVIDLDGVEFSAELLTTFMPPATPTSVFYEVWWNATNISPVPVTLNYCWLGTRFYSGSQVAWESPTYDPCPVSRRVTIPPGGATTISTAGTPHFHLGQGLPEGRYLMSVRWVIDADTLEVQAGEVQLLEHNGLTPPEEAGAETSLVVTGTSRTRDGSRPVRGFVGVRVHWEDCGRHPALWETTTTSVSGHFSHEAVLQEGIFEACVSVRLQPFDDEFESRIVEVGRLRLRKTATSGAPRDTLRVEIVY